MEISTPFVHETLNLQPVETQRASEGIYDQIKDLILSGRLKPGDRLPSERNMMDMMKRSRPTIREALRMLERSGFIRITAGTNGAVVQELGTSPVEQSLGAILQVSQLTLEELSEYRSLNDVAIAEWAAVRHTNDDLHKMEEIITKASLVLQDTDAFIALDPLFHGLMAKAAKNDVAYIMTQVFSRIVQDLMKTKMNNLSPVSRYEMCRKILNMHKSILEAIRCNNPDAARSAMQLHVDAFTEDLKME